MGFSGAIWFCWAPHFARRFRVERPDMRAWQQKIPNSTLLALPGESFHVAATDPDRYAREVREFILRAQARPGNAS